MCLQTAVLDNRLLDGPFAAAVITHFAASSFALTSGSAAPRAPPGSGPGGGGEGAPVTARVRFADLPLPRSVTFLRHAPPTPSAAPTPAGTVPGPSAAAAAAAVTAAGGGRGGRAEAEVPYVVLLPDAAEFTHVSEGFIGSAGGIGSEGSIEGQAPSLLILPRSLTWCLCLT